MTKPASDPSTSPTAPPETLWNRREHDGKREVCRLVHDHLSDDCQWEVLRGLRVPAWFTFDETSPIGGHIEIWGSTSESVPKISSGEFLGLLRLIGWQSGRDRELTEEEAELILEVAATQPVSDDDRARLRERVLNRKFGSTPQDETAWLIEHRGTGYAPTYWAGGKEFIHGHLKAVRFARKEDAEQVMRSTEQMKYTTKDLFATDHMWCARSMENPDV